MSRHTTRYRNSLATILERQPVKHLFDHFWLSSNDSRALPQQPPPCGDILCQSPSFRAYPFIYFLDPDPLQNLVVPFLAFPPGRGCRGLSELPSFCLSCLHLNIVSGIWCCWLVLFLRHVCATMYQSLMSISGCQPTASSAWVSMVSGRGKVISQFWFWSLCTMLMFPHGLVPWSPPSFCYLLLCLISPRSFSLYIIVTPPISSNVPVLSPAITLKIKINRPGHLDPL